MSSYDAVSFDDTGFSSRGEREGVRIWSTDAGDGIGLYHFAKPPDIGVDIHSLADVRKFYRNMAAPAGLGVIEIETPQIDGCIAVRSIFKSPQQPTGMTYMGSLTIPYRDFSYVVKVQCPEQGFTGMREAVVLDAMMEANAIQINDDGTITGWMQDPYDPTFNAPLMRNLAEDEHYDVDFPDHPLSRLRSILQTIQSSLRLATEIKNAPPFVFAEQSAKKPWWKRW